MAQQRIPNNTAVDNFGFHRVVETAPRTGLITRITRAISAFLAKEDVAFLPMVDSSRTSEIGSGTAGYSSFNNPQWRIQYDRRAVYFDLRDMDRNDPLVSLALDIHADCAVGYEDTCVDAFEWSLGVYQPEAQKILDDLKKRLDLGAEAWQIVRGFVLQGEEFREVVIDENYVIRRFKHLPSYQIMPMLDQFGNKAPGWQQRKDGQTFLKSIDFEEWQIVPFIYGAKQDGWRGTGLMASARRTWKRLSKMEDGMALARLIRAYDRYEHKVPVPPGSDARKQQDLVMNYKRNMTRKTGLDIDGNTFERENFWQVETDFYIPDDGTDKGGIRAITPVNTQLAHIEDVRYHQDQLIARLKVPRKYLGIGSGKQGALTDGSLSAEDIQFARTLRQEQAVLRSGLMRLAHMALLFGGFDADALDLQINLPKISTQDAMRNAQVQLTLAQAASFFEQVLGALPPDLVATKFMDLGPKDQESLSEFLIAKQEEEAEKLRAVISSPGQFLPGGQRFPNAGKLSSTPVVPRNTKGAGKTTNKGSGDDGGDDDGTQGARFEDIAHTVGRLKTMVQVALEKEGVRFTSGYEENVEQAREALAHVVSSNGRH